MAGVGRTDFWRAARFSCKWNKRSAERALGPIAGGWEKEIENTIRTAKLSTNFFAMRQRSNETFALRLSLAPAGLQRTHPAYTYYSFGLFADLSVGFAEESPMKREMTSEPCQKSMTD